MFNDLFDLDNLPSTVHMTNVFPKTASSSMVANTVHHANFPHNGKVKGRFPGPIQSANLSLNKRKNVYDRYPNR